MAAKRGKAQGLVGWVQTNPFTVVAVLFILAQAIPFYRKPPDISEWETVYLAGAHRLVGGGNLYNQSEGYLYPPFPAFCAVPFAYLNPAVGRCVWYAVNVLALWLLVVCAWKIAGGGDLQGPLARRTDQLAWWLGLACGFRYVLDGLAHQQIDVVLGALLMSGCWFITRSRPIAAATLLGLAAGMKCTPLLFCGYFLWRGYWRAALWLVGVAVGVNLLPNLVSTPAGGGLWLGEWLTSYLLPTQASQYYVGIWGSDPVYNQSLSGACYRFFVTDYSWTATGWHFVQRSDAPSPETLRRLLYAVEAGLCLLVLWAVGRPTRKPSAESPGPQPSRVSLEISSVLVMMLLLSPMSSKPHFCTLLLPGFCLARLAFQEKRRWLGLVVFLAVAAGMVSIKDLWGNSFATWALWWGSVTWSTLALLWGCVLGLVVRRPAWENRGEEMLIVEARIRAMSQEL